MGSWGNDTPLQIADMEDSTTSVHNFFFWLISSGVWKHPLCYKTCTCRQVAENVHSALVSAVSEAEMRNLTESVASKTRKKPCPLNEIFVDGKIFLLQ